VVGDLVAYYTSVIFQHSAMRNSCLQKSNDLKLPCTETHLLHISAILVKLSNTTDLIQEYLWVQIIGPCG